MDELNQPHKCNRPVLDGCRAVGVKPLGIEIERLCGFEINTEVQMGRSRVAGLVGVISLIGVTQAASEQICKPVLVFKDVQFSEMQPPTLARRWTAVVSVDASRCTTTVGWFEVGFSRVKETAPELEFREQFIWSAPSVKIGVDFAADEAVGVYWIDKVYACPCAR